ncbi:MAG: hypothetical protein ACI4VP_02810 [Clostridia bacterium]
MSYKETALIMEKTPTQIKTLAHNAKKKLKEELKKEGVIEMKNNKLVKVLLIVIIFIIGVSGLSYGVSKLYKYYKNANLNPAFSGSIGNVGENNVWVGTFQMAWNELLDTLQLEKIEFSDGESKLANELNKRSFTKDQISVKDYYAVSGPVNEQFRKTIENELQRRFNEESQILDKVDWTVEENRYLIYSMLKKEFTFKVPFPEMGAASFGDSKEKVKYFGLEDSTMENTFENVEALFYNSKKDFAVKIKTVEGEELLLYRTNSKKSFEEIYSELVEKSSKYNGRKTLEREKDKMKVPFIKVNSEINYDELCNRYIKGTDAYIEQAIQTVDFELDNYGGYVKSEAMIDMYMCISDKEQREFFFTDDFVLFMKEEGKEKPYFALRVNNTDVLVEKEQ